jgi:hypothetical protein
VLEKMIRKRSQFLIVLGMIAVLALAATAAGAAPKAGSHGGGKSGSTSTCTVSPSPVASGAALTVSGKAGSSGDWVNVYIYYSDGTWKFLGGSIGSGGTFSLSGLADATYTSLWGPFYPAASGPATVQVYAGSANRDLGMVATCSFSVS